MWKQKPVVLEPSLEVEKKNIRRIFAGSERVLPCQITRLCRTKCKPDPLCSVSISAFKPAVVVVVVVVPGPHDVDLYGH